VESFKNTGVTDDLRHGNFSNPDKWGALPGAGLGLTFSLPNSYRLPIGLTIMQGELGVDLDWYQSYQYLPPMYQNLFKDEYDKENRFIANNFDFSGSISAKIAPRGGEKLFGVTFADSFRYSWRETLKATDTSEEVLLDNGNYARKNDLHAVDNNRKSFYNRLTIRPEWMAGENRDHLWGVGGSWIVDSGNPDFSDDYGFGLDLFYGYYGIGKTSWSIGLTPAYMVESQKLTIPVELQIAPYGWRSFGGRLIFGLNYTYQPGRNTGAVSEPEKQSKAYPNIFTQTTTSNSVDPMHNFGFSVGFKFSPW
jgi:hypothetical protein